jgi:hypothetical protein
MAYSAIVSLALGLFQDFGTTRHAGQPPVDWANPQHVGMFSITRALGYLGSGHRLSMPPPRPAPCTALPPAPMGSDTESPATAPMATVKTVWRNSLARRALRLSLGQLATAQSLPHANDDHPSSASTSRSHSRSTSVDSVPLSSLPHGHAIPPALFEPPALLPTGPLLPPPVSPISIPAPIPIIPRTTSAPLIEMLNLIRKVMQLRRSPVPDGTALEPPIVNAYKVYPYLEGVLSGLTYPSKESLEEEEATQAKRDLYAFLFHGCSSTWPRGEGGKLILTMGDGGVEQLEPTYPLARMAFRLSLSRGLMKCWKCRRMWRRPEVNHM